MLFTGRLSVSGMIEHNSNVILNICDRPSGTEASILLAVSITPLTTTTGIVVQARAYNKCNGTLEVKSFIIYLQHSTLRLVLTGKAAEIPKPSQMQTSKTHGYFTPRRSSNVLGWEESSSRTSTPLPRESLSAL